MTTIASASPLVDRLRARCLGAVVDPADAGYDAARSPWHAEVDQRPAAVAFPADAADVAGLLAAAGEAGVRVTVQATGHGANKVAGLEDTILLRTSALNEVRIDAAARVARVGAGALWQDVVPAAAAHGLAPLAGSGPDVGVVGYTLGGGIGYLGRRHGLACNQVTAIELVRPDGEFVRADHESEPELFWALRGGSGSFGVVTAMEFRLFDVGSLYAGGLFWPWERAAEVLAAWRELTAGAPDELTSMWRLLQLPPFESVPEPLRGRAWVNVQLAFLGDAGAGAALLAPLRALGPELDFAGVTGPEALLRLHGEPEGPTPAITDHAMLDALPPAALDALLDEAGHESGSPLTVVELRHLGGALARTPEGAGALASLDAAYALHTVGVPFDPSTGPRSAALRERMAAFGRGRAYFNFARGPVALRDAFGAEDATRLAALRAQLDPGALLRAGLA